MPYRARSGALPIACENKDNATENPVKMFRIGLSSFVLVLYQTASESQLFVLLPLHTLRIAFFICHGNI